MSAIISLYTLISANEASNECNCIDYCKAEGTSFTGEVIGTLEVRNETECVYKCAVRDHCHSVNYTPGRGGTIGTCELIRPQAAAAQYYRTAYTAAYNCKQLRALASNCRSGQQ